MVFLTILFLTSVGFGVTTIDSCMNLNNANETYLLNTSILGNQSSNNCILINADNITLDCNGSAIVGYGFDKFGIRVVPNQKNIIIRNCQITNYSSGISISSSENIILLNNTIYGNLGHGILVSSLSSNISIFNNTIYNNSLYGIYLYSSSNNFITGNEIFNNSYFGIRLNYESSNNLITDNFVHGNLRHGFYLSVDSTNNSIYENFAYQNLEYGILISSPNNVIDNNIVYENVKSGIGILSNSSVVSNNTIYQNAIYGIFASSSSNNSISGNTVFNNSAYGFYIHKSMNSTFVNNMAYNNKQFGVRFYQSSNNLISNNTVYGNIGHGIHIAFGNENYLSGNIVYDNENHGIYLSGNNSIIENNQVYSNLLSGVVIHISYNSTFVNNLVYNNTQHGLFLSSSSNNTVNNNLVNSNSLYGIYLHLSSDNVISNNIVHTNSYFGIKLTRQSNHNILFNNSAYNNLNHGVYLDSNSSANIINKSYSYNNSKCGFAILSSDNFLINNEAYDNLNSGILLSSANNTDLTNNLAYQNSQYGLYLYLSSGSNLTNNSGYNNSYFGIRLHKSDNNNLQNNTVYKNSQYGLYLTSSSSNILSGNLAYENLFYGIALRLNSNNNTISDSLSHSNGGGIYIVESNNTILLNVRTYDHLYDFYIQGNPFSTTISVTNFTLDGPNGSMYEYAYFNLIDVLNPSESYVLNWSVGSDNVSQTQNKIGFIYLKTTANSSIDELSWIINESELNLFNFESWAWFHNSVVWESINSSFGLSSIKITDLVTSGIYAISKNSTQSPASSCVDLYDPTTYNGSVINSSGIFYINTNVIFCSNHYNLSDSIIIINSSFLTIDFNGAILDFYGSHNSGILFWNISNIDLGNAIINHPDYGIKLINSSYNHIFDINITNLDDTNNAVYINNSVSNNIDNLLIINNSGVFFYSDSQQNQNDLTGLKICSGQEQEQCVMWDYLELGSTNLSNLNLIIGQNSVFINISESSIEFNRSVNITLTGAACDANVLWGEASPINGSEGLVILQPLHKTCTDNVTIFGVDRFAGYYTIGYVANITETQVSPVSEPYSPPSSENNQRRRYEIVPPEEDIIVEESSTGSPAEENTLIIPDSEPLVSVSKSWQYLDTYIPRLEQQQDVSPYGARSKLESVIPESANVGDQGDLGILETILININSLIISANLWLSNIFGSI